VTLNEIINLATPIVISSGVVGVFVTYFLRVRGQKRDDERASKQLAAAFLGEISSVHFHIDTASYERVYRQLREEFKQGRNIKVTARNSAGEFFTIYKANAAHLGRLPVPLAERVAYLYVAYIALQEDLRSTIMPEWNACSIEQKLPTVNHILRRLTVVQRDGLAIVKLLQKYAGVKAEDIAALSADRPMHSRSRPLLGATQ
jgi:hypothetical protein